MQSLKNGTIKIKEIQTTTLFVFLELKFLTFLEK